MNIVKRTLSSHLGFDDQMISPPISSFDAPKSHPTPRFNTALPYSSGRGACPPNKLETSLALPLLSPPSPPPSPVRPELSVPVTSPLPTNETAGDAGRPNMLPAGLAERVADAEAAAAAASGRNEEREEENWPEN
jgi:hypothetical protein